MGQIDRSGYRLPTMLSLRAHVMIAAGIFAAIVVLAMLGNALEASGAIEASPGVRLGSIAVFLGLAVALAFSAVPVMVKLVLGAQRSAGNAGRPVVAALVAHERLIVVTMWALMALGLAVAIPGAILSGAFD